MLSARVYVFVCDMHKEVSWNFPYPGFQIVTRVDAGDAAAVVPPGSRRLRWDV